MIHSSVLPSSSVQVLSLHVGNRFESNLKLCFMRSKAELCIHDFCDNIAHSVLDQVVWWGLSNELERKWSWVNTRYCGFWMHVIIGPGKTITTIGIQCQCKMPIWFQELMKYQHWRCLRICICNKIQTLLGSVKYTEQLQVWLFHRDGWCWWIILVRNLKAVSWRWRNLGQLQHSDRKQYMCSGVTEYKST